MPVGVGQGVPWDTQNADPWGADVNQRPGQGNGSQEFGREAQASEQATIVFEVDTNEVVFDAPSGYGNVLEGVVIVYAPDRREVYAAGSLTEDVAAVELAHNHVGRSWSLGVPEQDYAKKLRYGDGTLWCVHLDGDDLFATSVPSSKAWHTFVTGSFAELCNLEFFQDRPALGIKRPVSLAECAPDNGDLFVVVVYDPAIETHPESITADNRHELSSRRLLHLRFENDNRIHLLGDFEAATKHVQQERQDPYREWLAENFPELEQLLEPLDPPTVLSVESIVDMTWLEQYEVGVEGVEGGALVLLVQDKEPGTNDILEQKLVLYRYENDSVLSTIGEEFALPGVSEIGVASQIAASSAGLVHVATNPIWLEDENVVVPGHLVGFHLTYPLFHEQYRNELTQPVDVKGLACNKTTGRIAVLHDRFYCPSRVPQTEFDPEEHAGHLIPPYLSWVDVYTPDLVAHRASHDATASVGIQSKDVVAIDGEFDVAEHEFAAASAGAAMLVLIPNLDRMGAASEVVTSVQAGAEVSQQFSLDGGGSHTVDAGNPVLDASLAPTPPPYQLAEGVDTGVPILPQLQLIEAAGEGEFHGYAGSGTAPVLICPEIQVGTAPYMMLFSNKYVDRLLVLSRLGGCQILMLQIPEEGAELPDLANPVLMHALGLTLLDSHHGVNQVGYWPCGMTQSESGDHIYVLSHFDRKLRVLDAAAMRSASMDNDPSVLVGLVDLPARTRLQAPEKTVEDAGPGNPPEELVDGGHLNPDYQYFDVLSELTATDDGMYQLALLGEVGEVHLIRTDEDQAEVVFSKTILPLADTEPRGPGRMQGMFEEWGEHTVVAWVYVKQYPNLDGMWSNVYEQDEEGYPFAETFNALVRLEFFLLGLIASCEVQVFDLDSAYSQSPDVEPDSTLEIQERDDLGRYVNPRRLVYFDASTSTIYVDQTAWRYSSLDGTVSLEGLVLDDEWNPISNRIVGTDSFHRLYGEFFTEGAQATQLLRKLSQHDDSYRILSEWDLGAYSQMKPQIDYRKESGRFQLAASQPTHAVVRLLASE